MRRFFNNFEVLFDARRELSKHLPRDFFDHAAPELHDLSDEVDIGVDQNLAATVGERRDSAQHRDLRGSGTTDLASVAHHAHLVRLFVDLGELRLSLPKRTKLFVICDVSGSMDLYSRLLLQFVYGLQNSFAKVESFVFATSLARITGDLKNKTYQRALDRLSANIRGWSGGTRIGASLSMFNDQWLRRIDKRTIVIILSDGWDTGEPESLAASLAQLKRRAGRLIWLNPLLGSADYAPVTRGMQAALPFISVFAPAHDLASLRALEPHLVL